MTFNVQQMPFWYTKFQQPKKKISLPWEGGTHTIPARSVASLPRFAPPPLPV